MAGADAEVRAALVECVMRVGAGHNRFYVMQVAARLLQGKKTPDERVALVQRLEQINPRVRTAIGGYVTLSDLDPALVPLLKPD